MINNKQKLDKPTKLHYKERRRKILQIFKKLGYTDVNKTQLAKQLGINRETLYKDLEALKDEIVKIPLKKVVFDYHIVDDFVVNKAREFLNSRNENAKLGALKLIAERAEKRLDFLQKAGLIEKPKEKIEIEQLNEYLELNKIYNDIIKQQKSKNSSRVRKGSSKK